MTSRRPLRFLVAGGLLAVVAACGGGATSTPGGTPAATLELSANNLAFDKTELRAPAGAPFAIHFTNQEAPPHNVSIHAPQALFTGETFSGPGERTYLVPALAAGEYEFMCDVHPEMHGTLISE